MNDEINYNCLKCKDVILHLCENVTYSKYDYLSCRKCPQCMLNHYQCTKCHSKLMIKKKQITNHHSYHNRKRKHEDVTVSTYTKHQLSEFQCNERLNECLDDLSFDINYESDDSNLENNISRKKIAYDKNASTFFF